MEVMLRPLHMRITLMLFPAIEVGRWFGTFSALRQIVDEHFDAARGRIPTNINEETRLSTLKLIRSVEEDSRIYLEVLEAEWSCCLDITREAFTNGSDAFGEAGHDWESDVDDECAYLHRDVAIWLNDTLTGRWLATNVDTYGCDLIVIAFKKESDAATFKLRWM